MRLSANPSLWIADAPAAWPAAPAEMTVTALREIESCSRRWALRAGHYPDVWNGRGYPPRVQLGALSGTVVHLALEVITKALVRAGCLSLHDPTVLQVLRNLGGYTVTAHVEVHESRHGRVSVRRRSFWVREDLQQQQ